MENSLEEKKDENRDKSIYTIQENENTNEEGYEKNIDEMLRVKDSSK